MKHLGRSDTHPHSSALQFYCVLTNTRKKGNIDKWKIPSRRYSANIL